MSFASGVPTLWDPQELFIHLAVWAGVPAIVMAVAAALLGIYKSVQAWIDLGKSTAHAAGVVGGKFRSWTEPQQRAMARLFVFSVLAVAFSYMLAVIVDAVARILQTSPPNTIPTIKDVVGRVGITPWPLAAFWTVAGVVFGITALGVACIADLHGLRKFVTGVGGVVWIAAWVLGAGLGCAAIMMCLGLLLEIGSSHPSDPVPVPLLVTSAVTAGVSLVLALLLPRVRAASADAFTPSRI